MMKIKTITAFLAASIIFASNAQAQVSGEERVFATRAAMLEIDRRCTLFNPQQRRALNAFMLQARGSILRAGGDAARLSLISSQARQGVATKPCNDAEIQAEAERIRRAHSGWRMQMLAEFPGIRRNWVASRAGVDNWRVWQELGSGVRAGYVLARNGLAFGVETPSLDVASARVYLRDVSKLGLPRSNSNLQPPPRMGTKLYNATAIVPAQTKAKVDSATRSGTLVLFSDEVTRAVIAADPRDCFEVEIISRNGTASRYIVEVGDVIAAFALGAEI